MKKFLPALILFLVTTKTQAQDLPHWLTQEEQLLLPTYLQNHGNTLRGTDPPTFTPRAMAEWEEISGLLITWTSYTPILRQIVEIAQPECTVYIVCSDSNSVKTNLTNNGISIYNIKFLEEPYNSVWSRDYGQWNIYKDDVDELSFVDWIYNRPRPLDDVIPVALADYTGLPLYSITNAPYDLVHTGGNFMVDGHGTGFSSKLILDENGINNDFYVTEKTEADIDTIMKKYLGLNRYILMETLPYDVIHHIDMHMKLLDEETLLVGEFPTGVSDGPQIETNLQYIQDNYWDCYGRPYRIVRIPMVPSTGGSYPPSGDYRTYANAVFINKTILIPLYREEYDTTAVRIYKENLPGYNVVGIDCDNSGADIISALGAVHCITKEIGQSDPIWIDHAPLLNTSDDINPYLVEAKIETPSGVTDATLYWTTDTAAGFTPETMTAELTDSFYAYIPAQISGTQVFYYINASSNSGRNISKPLTAPQGWLRFKVQVPSGSSEIKNPSIILYDPFPNPASSSVNIGFVLPRVMSCKLFLTDILGRIVFTSANQTLHSGQHKFTVDVSALPAGVYHLNLVAEDQLLEKKVLVGN
ncbi:MAG TPA: agmatine deiminase family protein [Chitinophagales bacterium]|nr:agmatine deiminase family protein [Chitinophagales bacterium]